MKACRTETIDPPNIVTAAAAAAVQPTLAQTTQQYQHQAWPDKKREKTALRRCDARSHQPGPGLYSSSMPVIYGSGSQSAQRPPHMFRGPNQYFLRVAHPERNHPTVVVTRGANNSKPTQTIGISFFFSFFFTPLEAWANRAHTLR